MTLSSVNFCMSDCNFEGYTTVTYYYDDGREIVVLYNPEENVFQVVRIDTSAEVEDFEGFAFGDYNGVINELKRLAGIYGSVPVGKEFGEWVVATAND